MRVAITTHRSPFLAACPAISRASGLGLLTLALLGGCVSQDYYRATGQSVATGAMQGVRDGIVGIQEPLRQTLRGALVDDPVLKEAARDMLVLATSGGLVFFWWRYQQSAKTLTIVAETINDHQSGALKDTIKKSTHDNYVGPWFSSFLKRRGL